ncbi:MAG: hypothetical protein A2268_15495 [Candidatus Raymondbacteria bacterium RifOxyA12_full_50_37]|uniref:Uncharacterized protein n=1 Tax=Candidatus Raymondbacteria bacterium RIFOXYD12_FULL_49_13 TaxID=1817890 RepID=A0A1F7F3M6_UNCRA|nr:MAG: hypothetical protein A2268_15495 [Candidatus Raymondbacteria bacterium RifOxyA12_full_50_37]OGJ87292.1 MAG: hypothetical protein A2350_04400 [Candidatus Raymondbacteria bacterium RifOxyB12_full_50_8]OGJ88442.1 MAG: hypothetical protein A2248_19770 [Candidatus Raymondbacteria bacterium RIFOXYA2_FULL_49_16]OGJ98902.1 MAG: hypothetical protein A2453_10485 [Candidatus Raymondbacteria bacterium RIFOXYC2_FULL_50_21]OGK01241.1 MAG: hypothetical protein A2519_22565 [Candidatus Raymondbacteria b
MRRCAGMLLLCALSLPSIAGSVFDELRIGNFFNTPDRQSVVSPAGTYFVTRGENNSFDVVNTKTGDYVLRSRFTAWIPPYPDLPGPTHIYFVFSPDERYLVTDNYLFEPGQSAPLKSWIVVWDLQRNRVESQRRGYDEPAGYTYDVRSSLEPYQNPLLFKQYIKNQRLVFSPDGATLYRLFPAFAAYIFPGLAEIPCEATDMIGAIASEKRTFAFIGAPLFAGPRETIMQVGDNLFLFHNFPNSIQNYTKMPYASDHIELSPSREFLIVGNSVFRYGFLNAMASFNGPGYFSGDSRTVMAGTAIFSGDGKFYPQSSYFTQTELNIPSSDRKYIFTIQGARRDFIVYSFSSGELLQTLELKTKETLLRNTDDGKALIFRDDFTGQIRVFERRN